MQANDAPVAAYGGNALGGIEGGRLALISHLSWRLDVEDRSSKSYTLEGFQPRHRTTARWTRLQDFEMFEAMRAKRSETADLIDGGVRF